MRKLPRDIDNPVDSLLVDIADIIDPYFKGINMTPNMITTLGLISALISIYLFCIKNYKVSAIFFFLSYFFDCVDGNFARKYNMITDFGDYYDHTVDLFKSIVMYGLLFYTLYVNNQILLIILLILLLALQLIHLGCQEIYVEKTRKELSSYVLSELKPLCLDTSNEKNAMGYTRFVGCGTVALVTAIVIFSMDYLIALPKP